MSDPNAKQKACATAFDKWHKLNRYATGGVAVSIPICWTAHAEEQRRETWKNGYSTGFEAAKGLLVASTAQPTLPDDERTAFEKWALREGYNCDHSDGESGPEYLNEWAAALWEAWQARAAAHQPGALPDDKRAK